MNLIHDIVSNILKEWNFKVKEAGHKQEYIVDVKCRNKKFYINKKDFFEQYVAEFNFICKGKPSLLLWRKELRMPDKIQGMQKHQVETEYIKSLYNHFLYECIGNFSLATKALITSQDYAEYDLDNDRLKQHESANGMVVSVLKDGEFFEKGNDFDVFMQTDNHYFVYTAHDVAIKNNGIAKINKADCLVKENAKVRVKLITEL